MGTTDRPSVIKKKQCLSMQSFTYSSNTGWITCKAKIIHHDRIFVIWTSSPYESETRSQYQKWQFALDKIDNIFISLVFFESYFGGKMMKKSWSFGIFTTCYRKNQWGKGSMFNIHNSLVIIPFFSFSYFERIFSTGIFFYESELTFVTLTLKYAFWAFLHTTFALISGRALSFLSPLNCSLSTCCSCGSTSMSLCTLCFKIVDVVICHCHETFFYTIESMSYIEFLATRAVLG